jgi:hypothetical protein
VKLLDIVRGEIRSRRVLTVDTSEQYLYFAIILRALLDIVDYRFLFVSDRCVQFDSIYNQTLFREKEKALEWLLCDDFFEEICFLVSEDPAELIRTVRTLATNIDNLNFSAGEMRRLRRVLQRPRSFI